MSGIVRPIARPKNMGQSPIRLAACLKVLVVRVHRLFDGAAFLIQETGKCIMSNVVALQHSHFALEEPFYFFYKLGHGAEHCWQWWGVIGSVESLGFVDVAWKEGELIFKTAQ